MRLLHRCLLTLLLPALLLGAMPALARPALWMAKQADSTVYLFGTVHLLPSETDWRFPGLQQALGQSQSLYLELIDDDQVTMTALVLRYGLDPAHPLSTQLNASDNAALAKAALVAGLPGGGQALQSMKPWLAALTLSVAPLVKAGFDPAQGVDKQLKLQMSADGKPVLGLETAEQQVQYLAGMSATLQLDFLRDSLRDADKAAAELRTLVDAWKKGDVDTIARLENEDLKSRAPELYRRLLVDRNKAWADRIKTLLQQPGTVFIAVGAAHLAGPDSVQAQLAKLGIATQVQ